jgi:CheY-like chemotaxis protein
VELHGGVITVQSDGAQRGATFTVSLPRAAVRRATDHAARRHPTSERDVNFECPPELAGLRVLVVDDADDARALLVIILERCGSKVSSAASVDAALKIIAEPVPDVIVSDIGMPERDGYELIRQIRALPWNSVRNVPAAALTAYARADDRRKAILAGFQMHLAKPVEPAELVAVIANLARIGAMK